MVAVVSRSENNKNETKRGSRGGSYPGPRTKVKSMSRQSISNKNILKVNKNFNIPIFAGGVGAFRRQVEGKGGMKTHRN